MQIKLFVLMAVHLTWVGLAQDYYPRKDAAFGQVAVGEGLETVMNLTNRGIYPYEGIIQFARGHCPPGTWQRRREPRARRIRSRLESSPRKTARISAVICGHWPRLKGWRKWPSPTKAAQLF